ncbi:hypothetical protein [Pantoea agglomerans]|uniref:hypothetical protein n=1 Tax=Enterobacter agglomerans TaxID=549 RepID=UPI001654B739|nr:hypothetical protein [Pantoea agglomerans]
MKKSKAPSSKKAITSLAISAVVVGIMMILLPEKFQTTPLALGLCAIVGSFFASLFQRSSNKKTEKLKRDAELDIDILYTSHKIKKGHKVILMSKVQRELEKIIHDEIQGKEVNEARKEVLFSLVHKYKSQGIVIDNEALAKITSYERNEHSTPSEKDDSVNEQLKNHTVTQLFLVSKRQDLFWAKNIAILATTVSAGIAHFYYPTHQLISLIPAFLYLALLIKEMVLTRRVEMGYFGKNKFEAIQLLIFIEKNKDNLDLNGPRGSKRKIFKATVIEGRRVPVGGVEGVYQ